MGLYQRGVCPVCAHDHLLEHSVVQIQIVGRLCSEVTWLEYGDIDDIQIPIADCGSKEKSPVLAFVSVPFVH